MGNIYREVVCKKKAKAIILIVLLVSFKISISTFLSDIRSINKMDRIILNTVFTVITIMFIVFEVFQCMTKYKYSIMIDKFMIHRIYSNNQTTLENIDLDDIVYIGRNRRNKFNCRKLRRRLYMCDIFTGKRYCCVYKDGSGYKKFYFQPSSELIDRIEKLRNANFVLDA